MKENQEYKPQLRAENNEGLKRREFLQTAVGGVLLGVLSDADVLEAKSRPHTLDDIFFRSIHGKIEFEDAQDLSGGYVKEVLDLVQELQDKILNLQNDLSSFSSESILMMKQKSWSQFRAIPELRPFFHDQFSEREFDSFILHELPRYLAGYSVFTRITNAPVFHKKRRDLLANMYLLDKYDVAQRHIWKSDNLWGKKQSFQNSFSLGVFHHAEHQKKHSRHSQKKTNENLGAKQFLAI
ncbi:MAG: hypothetical protein G01um101466_635 [Parcubacteria group bacterium Gr01-1014_66]|nr:MAG: hypothetical protein G01um101466_635 [Parcubacteria group bacterium Gr01-1014_66]